MGRQPTHLSLLSGATLNVRGCEFDKAPELTDFAVAMGRAARFAGQTNHWWSVLHHTYAGYIAMRHQGLKLSNPAVKRWMVHDAHEALTGDVPSPVKPGDMKLFQKCADLEFVKVMPAGWPKASESVIKIVSEIDYRMLKAEAYALHPPMEEQKFVEVFGGLPEESDVRIVQAVHEAFPSSLSSAEAWSSPLVRWWVGRLRGFMLLPGAWGVDDSDDLYMIQRLIDKQNEAYGDLYGEDGTEE